MIMVDYFKVKKKNHDINLILFCFCFCFPTLFNIEVGLDRPNLDQSNYPATEFQVMASPWTAPLEVRLTSHKPISLSPPSTPFSWLPLRKENSVCSFYPQRFQRIQTPSF